MSSTLVLCHWFSVIMIWSLSGQFDSAALAPNKLLIGGKKRTCGVQARVSGVARARAQAWSVAESWGVVAAAGNARARHILLVPVRLCHHSLHTVRDILHLAEQEIVNVVIFQNPKFQKPLIWCNKSFASSSNNFIWRFIASNLGFFKGLGF